MENVSSFEILSSTPEDSHATTIVCQGLVAFSFRNISHMTMFGLTINACGKGIVRQDMELYSPFHYDQGPNTAMYGVSVNSVLYTNIANCSFQDSAGTAVAVLNSSLDIRGSNHFTSNCRRCGNYSCLCFGGGIFANMSTLVFTGNNAFRANSATLGGGIFAQNSILNFSGSSTFGNNSAARHGGGIAAYNSTLNFNGSSTFENNSAVNFGGGIDATYNNLVTFSGISIFGNNSAEYGGGIYGENSDLNFDGDSTFRNNCAAVTGGGIFMFQNNTLSFTGSINILHNSAVAGGGMSALYSAMKFTGNCIFANNTADGYAGGIYVFSSTGNFNGNSTFGNNSARIGGGIYARESTLSITGDSPDSIGEHTRGGHFCMSIFITNSAVIHGGAVYTEDSVLSFQGHNIFSGNSANYYAGGVYSESSTLKFSGSTSFNSNSGQFGGGIYGLGASLHFSGNGSFTANTATRGGGQYLVNSFNFLSQHASVTMDANNATEYGGAVYVEDSDPISYCFPESFNLQRCLIQADGLFQSSITEINVLLPGIFDPATTRESLQLNESAAHAIRAFLNISIHFSNNHAQKAGSAVYGGSVDNCAIHLGINTTEDSVQVYFRLYWHVPNLQLQPNSISSDPFQLCLCNDGVIHCNTSKLDRHMQVYPGQLLKLPIVATGQRNGIVPAVVRAFFNGTHKNISLAPFQDTQDVPNICTELYYQVHSSSSNNSGTLVLYADGPCSTNGRLLEIPLEFRDCPRGFGLNPSQGICECESRLQEYTTRCNITERTLEHNGEFWVGYDDHSEGLILHPHCPFDYCRSAHINVTLNDTDKQCQNNRSGLLCGECKSGFSLALGSSKCLPCSNIYILLVIPFALAGIALVLLLFVFKLTVAAGTINGLILYANIVAVNRSIFFPNNETTILSVFIAWLNLDLGIEVCFIDGLDVYVKTWLQFVFPLYVWSLVGLIIFASKYSSRVTRLFGSNPVAVLATLFFLSYAKLLRNILKSLYFTFLEYPDEVWVAVWMYDGNIVYFYSKHIALFLVALITFLVLFLPYTFLLTARQWLQAKSNQRFFNWINKPTIKPFLDAYHAPYRDQHRYWTGLLLCLRCVLFTVFGLVSLLSADPSHNLLAIEAVVIGLVTLTRFTGVIYKKLYLDILEASFILNLGFLAAVTYSVRLAKIPESQQAIVTYLSVGIAFATFVGVLVYHTYQHIWPKVKPKIQQLHHCKEHQSESFDEADIDNRTQTSTAPTMTIVECPSPEPPEFNARLSISNKTFTELREPLLELKTNDHTE